MKIKLNTNNIFFLKKGGWLCRLSFDTIKTTDLAKKNLDAVFMPVNLERKTYYFHNNWLPFWNATMSIKHIQLTPIQH